MKKVILKFLSLLGLLILPSCSVQEQSPYEVWTGRNMNFMGNTPATAVLTDKRIEVREWKIIKCFCDVNELHAITNCLDIPERFEFDSNFIGEHTLVIYYVLPNKPVVIPFSFDDVNEEIVTSRGRCKELYKIVTEKEPSKSFWNKPPDNLLFRPLNSRQ